MKVYIPEMSKERVAEIAQRIRPVIRFGDGLRYIEPVDLHTMAYTWEPKPAEQAEGLVDLCDITTYHKYYGFFKPSIAEVLKQIPQNILNQVVAFQIVGSPNTPDDLNDEREALNAGYHVATTRLFCSEV